MKQALALTLTIIVAVALAFPVLAYLGYNWPLPFADWGHQIYALFSGLTISSFSKIPSTVWALIGSLGGMIGVTGGTIYAWLKKRASLLAEKLAHSTTKTEAATQINTLNSDIQTKSTALDQLTAEKDAVTTKLTNVQDLISKHEATITQQKAQIDSVLSQNQALMNQLANAPSKVVQQLK